MKDFFFCRYETKKVLVNQIMRKGQKRKNYNFFFRNFLYFLENAAMTRPNTRACQDVSSFFQPREKNVHNYDI